MEMNQPLDALEWLLQGPARWRKARGGATPKRRTYAPAEGLKAISRITAKTPEVMVRISGKAKGTKHVLTHLQYITREGELMAEDENGCVINGKAMVKDTAAAWMEGSALARRSNSRDTVNIILSMPPDTDRDKLLMAARQFARLTFGNNHSYLLVRHDDTQHPHCHLTVRSLGVYGHRLNPKRNDLQAWRTAFAVACRQHGLAAEATPRRIRGVIRKPMKQAVLHADRAKRSSVQRAKVRDAFTAMANPETQPSAHEQAALIAQQQARNDWQQLAEQLAQASAATGPALAQQIKRFLADMPPAETERMQIHKQIRHHIKQQQEQQHASQKRTL
jgi:type IV secretion system T-DNA border endonuclease VirD2